jgi:hypothetical protein
MSGELVTVKEFGRRNHLDRRTILRWIQEDPTFPALRKDPWPGHTQARYLIALDLIPKWVEGRRAREFEQEGEAR